NKLFGTYQGVVDGLFTNSIINKDVYEYVGGIFDFLRNCTNREFTKSLENAILAQGELLSTYMFNSFLKQEGVNSVLLPALEFMRIDKFKEPDLTYIKKKLESVISTAPKSGIYITQGFICLDEFDDISNLQRGGS